MSIQPHDEVFAKFGVRLVAPLGGRLNQHWLATRSGVPALAEFIALNSPLALALRCIIVTGDTALCIADWC
jgi:hypothetical protein